MESAELGYLKSVCLVRNVPFYGLLEAAKQFGEYEIVQALICDSSYNFRWMLRLLKSEHYFLRLQDMSQFAKFLSVGKDVEAHKDLSFFGL